MKKWAKKYEKPFPHAPAAPQGPPKEMVQTNLKDMEKYVKPFPHAPAAPKGVGPMDFLLQKTLDIYKKNKKAINNASSSSTGPIVVDVEDVDIQEPEVIIDAPMEAYTYNGDEQFLDMAVQDWKKEQERVQ